MSDCKAPGGFYCKFKRTVENHATLDYDTFCTCAPDHKPRPCMFQVADNRKFAGDKAKEEERVSGANPDTQHNTPAYLTTEASDSDIPLKKAAESMLASPLPTDLTHNYEVLSARLIKSAAEKLAKEEDKAVVGHRDMSAESKGIKHDQEKLMWSLLDTASIEGLIRVLMFGAKKYSAHNWRKGFDWTRLTDACQRHIAAILKGEDLDPETGELHAYHLLCEAMFLAAHMREGLGTDNRLKVQRSEAAPSTDTCCSGKFEDSHFDVYDNGVWTNGKDW